MMMAVFTLVYAVMLLYISCRANGFLVVPAATSASSSCHSMFCSTSPPTKLRVGATARTRGVYMMAGFGKKTKETPPLPGAGKGQRAYERQMKAFNGLKGAGAEIVDVYVYETETDNDKFIFAGKVARSSGISVEQALQWQRDLIVDHVKVLEPKTRPPVRIFTAPGNSEVEVARNMHDLVWRLGGKGPVSTSNMRSEEVGYMPELYDDDEPYYYVRKLEDGKSPAPPADVMIESMDKMVEAGVIPPGAGAPSAE